MEPVSLNAQSEVKLTQRIFEGKRFATGFVNPIAGKSPSNIIALSISCNIIEMYWSTGTTS